MLNQLNKIKNYFFSFIISLGILCGQNTPNLLNVSINSSTEESWWSKFNNFGYNSNSSFQNTTFEIRDQKFEFISSIFSPLNNITDISFNETYFKVPIKDYSFIRLGKYYRDFSTYLNDDISSGSLLISKNAEAMPKIGISSTKYIDRKNEMSFNYGISHGMFEINKFYKKAPMLHEKFVYLKYNNENIEWGFGLVHEAIWGGTTIGGRMPGAQPDSFKDFLKIIIAGDGPNEGGDHTNSLGNHLGIWDFYYSKKQHHRILTIYYQHFFEDTSGLRFANKTDGLWGIEFQNFIKNNTILIEYLNTFNQNIDPPYVDDSYYIHGLYQSGWSYKGYTLGNPFIDFKNNNPSKVMHLGMKRILDDKYNFKFLLSRKIHESDNFKYHLMLGKLIKNISANIIFVGEKNYNNIEMKLTFNL